MIVALSIVGVVAFTALALILWVAVGAKQAMNRNDNRR